MYAPPTYFNPGYFASSYFSGEVAQPGEGGIYFPPSHFPSAYFAPSYFPGAPGTIAPQASLPEAVLAWWDAQPSLASAFPGGLWRDETPPEEVFPYATFSVLGYPAEYFTGGWRQVIESGQVWFNVYCHTARQADQLAQLILEAFSDADLLITGKTLMSLRRTNYPSSLLTSEKAPGSLDVWQSVSQFDFMLGPATI